MCARVHLCVSGCMCDSSSFLHSSAKCFCILLFICVFVRDDIWERFGSVRFKSDSLERLKPIQRVRDSEGSLIRSHRYFIFWLFSAHCTIAHMRTTFFAETDRRCSCCCSFFGVVQRSLSLFSLEFLLSFDHIICFGERHTHAYACTFARTLPCSTTLVTFVRAQYTPNISHQ